MEKSRSWPSAHDWKSCIPQKGIEGSNPSFSAILNLSEFSEGFFFLLHMSKLDATNLHWREDEADDPDDLCLHGQ